MYIICVLKLQIRKIFKKNNKEKICQCICTSDVFCLNSIHRNSEKLATFYMQSYAKMTMCSSLYFRISIYCEKIYSGACNTSISLTIVQFICKKKLSLLKDIRGVIPRTGTLYLQY